MSAAIGSYSTTDTGLLLRLTRLRHRPVPSYLVGLALFAVALLVRFALEADLPPGFPFLTFFPAVVLSTFFAGPGPGALTGVLSLLASWYWFLKPTPGFQLSGDTALAIVLFALIAFLDVVIIDRVVRMQQRLEAEQATTVALLEQRTTLFHELQHRVSNNLAMVATVLGAQQRRFPEDSEAVAAFAETRQRLDLMSTVHRRLHDPALAERDFGAALSEVSAGVLAGAGYPIAVDVSVDPVHLGPDERMALCLLVVELLTNAVKHAFPPERRDGYPVPRTAVSLTRGEGEDDVVLTVVDNGVGTQDDQTEDEHLGLRIVHSLVRSLEGSVEQCSGPDGHGTAVTVRFRRRGAD